LQGFIHDRLEVSGKPHYNERTTTTEHFDVVVYGSDQIWRKQNMGGVGFDDWYFGAANVQAEKKIVYAGSMGTVKTTTSDDEYVSRMMQNFQAISVREADLQSYLQKLHIPSTLVVDPVFLLSKEQWNQVAAPRNDKEGKYILFYNLLNKVESVHFAERLSKETGLPIKEINKKMSFHHIGKRYISTASVPEFLRLVRDADYVVSNSFHGVAFSLIFQKQFFAVGMGEKANRVISLLSCLGIVQRYIDNQLSFEKIDAIDYEKTTYILSSLFSASQNNLSESLNI
jgi:polysaccharide pyruvyl transferase WcaK-like protein